MNSPEGPIALGKRYLILNSRNVEHKIRNVISKGYARQEEGKAAEVSRGQAFNNE